MRSSRLWPLDRIAALSVQAQTGLALAGGVAELTFARPEKAEPEGPLPVRASKLGGSSRPKISLARPVNQN